MLTNHHLAVILVIAWSSPAHQGNIPDKCVIDDIWKSSGCHSVRIYGWRLDSELPSLTISRGDGAMVVETLSFCTWISGHFSALFGSNEFRVHETLVRRWDYEENASMESEGSSSSCWPRKRRATFAAHWIIMHHPYYHFGLCNLRYGR